MFEIELLDSSAKQLLIYVRCWESLWTAVIEGLNCGEEFSPDSAREVFRMTEYNCYSRAALNYKEINPMKVIGGQLGKLSIFGPSSYQQLNVFFF